LYRLIADLLTTHYPKFSKVIYILAVILITAIGFSRLYLGVHRCNCQLWSRIFVVDAVYYNAEITKDVKILICN
jgi:hypothetical protein